MILANHLLGIFFWQWDKESFHFLYSVVPVNFCLFFGHLRTPLSSQIIPGWQPTIPVVIRSSISHQVCSCCCTGSSSTHARTHTDAHIFIYTFKLFKYELYELASFYIRYLKVISWFVFSQIEQMALLVFFFLNWGN